MINGSSRVGLKYRSASFISDPHVLWPATAYGPALLCILCDTATSLDARPFAPRHLGRPMAPRPLARPAQDCPLSAHRTSTFLTPKKPATRVDDPEALDLLRTPGYDKIYRPCVQSAGPRNTAARRRLQGAVVLDISSAVMLTRPDRLTDLRPARCYRRCSTSKGQKKRGRRRSACIQARCSAERHLRPDAGGTPAKSQGSARKSKTASGGAAAGLHPRGAGRARVSGR
ncbi:unnamed protein product [Boreogadus saida]